MEFCRKPCHYKSGALPTELSRHWPLRPAFPLFSPMAADRGRQAKPEQSGKVRHTWAQWCHNRWHTRNGLMRRSRAAPALTARERKSRMDGPVLRHAFKPSKGTPKGALQAFLQAVAAFPPEECVLWPYGTDGSGYGQLRYRGGKIGAHRLSWELFHGRKMAAGFYAAHAPEICHNRLCVNPIHIREATPAENVADRVADGTANRGERHGNCKLTAEQVQAIRTDQRLLREVASHYGICEVTVLDIKEGRTWTWL